MIKYPFPMEPETAALILATGLYLAANPDGERNQLEEVLKEKRRYVPLPQSLPHGLRRQTVERRRANPNHERGRRPDGPTTPRNGPRNRQARVLRRKDPQRNHPR